MAGAKHIKVVQGHAQELEGNISRLQSSLATAQERHQHLQGQCTQLTQRCSNSIAALDAILSVSNLIPAAPVPTNAPEQGM